MFASARPSPRHSRACRGHLAETSTQPPNHPQRPPPQPVPLPVIPAPSPPSPRPQLRHTRAPPRVSRRQHSRRRESPPTVIPAHPPFPSLPRPPLFLSFPPRAGIGPDRPPTPAPRVRRPKLDLEPAPGPNRGPIRRSLAAQRTEPPANGVGRPLWTPGAADRVGYGPQIKFGATDPWGAALGAELGEIAAAERGNDGSWARRRSAPSRPHRDTVAPP